MKIQTRYMLILCLILFPTAALAQNFECPEPTKQVANDIKGDLNGQAQTLIKLGSLDIKGRFESTVVDLFSKYKNADQVAIAQNLLSPACNFLKSSDMPGSEKFDKWLQIFPLVSKYFPPDKRSDVPEPKETAGLYITYYKAFFDRNKVLNALKNEGINVDVFQEQYRRSRTTAIFCAPTVRKEAIIKIALTLLDAGVPLSMITPSGVEAAGIENPPDIRLLALGDGSGDGPYLTRQQILAIDDCKKEYPLVEGSIKRTVAVHNACSPRAADFYYSLYDPYAEKWSKVLHAEIDYDKTVNLMDGRSFFVTSKYAIYYYADAVQPDGEGAYPMPVPAWHGRKGDGLSVQHKLQDGRTVYFKRKDLTVSPDGLVLQLGCS